MEGAVSAEGKEPTIRVIPLTSPSQRKAFITNVTAMLDDEIKELKESLREMRLGELKIFKEQLQKEYEQTIDLVELEIRKREYNAK